MTTYEYGAVSSRFSLQADNKLIAYATMCLHYGDACGLIAIYEPVECRCDSWITLWDSPKDDIDKIFLNNSGLLAEEYALQHIEEIKACFETIKAIV